MTKAGHLAPCFESDGGLALGASFRFVHVMHIDRRGISCVAIITQDSRSHDLICVTITFRIVRVLTGIGQRGR
jgi:hypothetical protein